MTAKEKLREQVETLSEKEAERLLAMVQRAKERDAIGEAIAEGYRRVPQNSDEDAWAAANAREAIREERW
jgi:endonuclease YncB( thermonuclease family)